MKIPQDAVIPAEKLTKHLLVWRDKNDKSGFLARAGFTSENPTDLEQALRRLIFVYDAVQDRQDEYGVFYQVVGDLVGSKGVLYVVTIWMRRAADGQIRFVTLKPAR